MLPQAGVQLVAAGFSNFMSQIGKASAAIVAMGNVTKNKITALNQLGQAADKAGAQMVKLTRAMQPTAAQLKAQGMADYIRSLGQATNAIVNLGRMTQNRIQALQTIGVSAKLVAGEMSGMANKTKKAGEAVVESASKWEQLVGVLKAVVAGFSKVFEILGFVFNIVKKIGGIVVGALTLPFKILSALLPQTSTGFKGLGDNLFEAMFKFEVLKQVIRRIIQEIKDLSNTSVRAAIDLQTLTIRLDNLIARQARSAGVVDDYSTSIQVASSLTQELLDWVRQLSLATPFSEDAIAKTLSMSIGMGWAVGAAQELTAAILDYTAGMGLGNEIMERIIFNFAQMKAAGKVTATELRDLARGAFFPMTEVMDEAARILGVTIDSMEEFRRMMADGSVDVETFFQAFISVVNRDFPDAAQRMNTTLSALEDNIKDFFKVIIGWNVFGPVVAQIAEDLNRAFYNFMNSGLKPGARAMRSFEEQTKLLGQAMLELYRSITTAFESIKSAIANVLSAFGITMPTIRDFATALAYAGIIIEKLGVTIQNFINEHILPLAQTIAGTYGGDFSSLIRRAFTWGYNLVVNFANGIIRAAGNVLTRAMDFISQMLAYFMAPGSPPRIAPDIDEWGLATAAEWLHGFTMADFDILNSLGDSLRSALDAMVNLGWYDEVAAAEEYVGVMYDLMEAVNQLNETGEISGEIFGRLRSIGSVFGDELAILLERQVELARGIERAEIAQKAYNAAVEASKQATGTVNKLIKAYNALLRGGAGKDVLRSKLSELNAAEQAMYAAREQEKLKKAEAEAAEAALEPLREAVKLQEELIKQLIALAQAQADLEEARRRRKAGGRAGAGGEEEPIGFGLPTFEQVKRHQNFWPLIFAKIRRDAEEQLGTLWDTIVETWNTSIDSGLAKLHRRWWIFVQGIKTLLHRVFPDLDGITASITAAGEALDNDLGPAISNILDDFSTGSAQALADVLTGLRDLVEVLGANPSAVGASTSNVIDMLEAIGEVAGLGVIPMLGAITRFFLALAGVAAGGLIAVLSGDTTALSVSLDKLGLSFQNLQVKFDTFMTLLMQDFFGINWQALATVIGTGFLVLLAGLFPPVAIGLALLLAVVAGINWVINNWETIKTKIQELATLISQEIPTHVRELQTAFYEWFWSSVNSAWNLFVAWMTTNFPFITSILDAIGIQIDEDGIRLEEEETTWFTTAMQNAINGLVAWLLQPVNSFAATIVTTLLSLPDWSSSMMDLANGFVEMVAAAFGSDSIFYQLAQAIYSVLAEALAWAWSQIDITAGVGSGAGAGAGSGGGGGGSSGIPKSTSPVTPSPKPSWGGDILPGIARGISAMPASRTMAMSPVAAPAVTRTTTVSFGDVILNNNMDWSVFKQQVQKAILDDL